MAVKILGMNEEEFYLATPRKLFKLLDIHNQINNPNKQKNTKPDSGAKYIDEISF